MIDLQIAALPFGTFKTPNGLFAGLWSMERPKTGHWGSGGIDRRIRKIWGECDVKFGKQDQVQGLTIDISYQSKPTVVADWANLPFRDEVFKSGYWDPPYLGSVGQDGDVHYDRMDNCLREICRVCAKQIFILSPLIYPCPRGWKRSAVIAVTFGPNKVIRCLQGFKNHRWNQPSLYD